MAFTPKDDFISWIGHYLNVGLTERNKSRIGEEIQKMVGSLNVEKTVIKKIEVPVIIRENTIDNGTPLDRLHYANIVKDRISMETGIPIDKILSSTRQTEIKAARNRIVLECLLKYNYSFSELGRIINRDRTSVYHIIQGLNKDFYHPVKNNFKEYNNRKFLERMRAQKLHTNCTQVGVKELEMNVLSN